MNRIRHISVLSLPKKALFEYLHDPGLDVTIDNIKIKKMKRDGLARYLGSKRYILTKKGIAFFKPYLTNILNEKGINIETKIRKALPDLSDHHIKAITTIALIDDIKQFPDENIFHAINQMNDAGIDPYSLLIKLGRIVLKGDREFLDDLFIKKHGIYNSLLIVFRYLLGKGIKLDEEIENEKKRKEAERKAIRKEFLMKLTPRERSRCLVDPEYYRKMMVKYKR